MLGAVHQAMIAGFDDPLPFERGREPRPAAGPVDPLAGLLGPSRSGDRVALRRLIDALTPHVLRAATAVLGARHPDVDDVSQVALVDVVRALPSFRGECPIAHFATRIATRRAIEARRRARAQAGRAEPLEGEQERLVDGTPTPDRVALRARCEQLWARLIEQLPEPQAEAVVLRVLLEYSLEEAAATAGVPVNTLRSRLRLARETIQRKIDATPGLADLLIEVGP